MYCDKFLTFCLPVLYGCFETELFLLDCERSQLIMVSPLVHSSLIQIKSHAQKVLKRQEAGDNIFRRLEEHCARLHALLCDAHARLGLEPPTVADVTSKATASDGGRTMQPALGKRRRQSSTNTHQQHDNPAAAADKQQPPQEQQQQPPKKKGATEHIMAASALCQLAGPEDEEKDEADEPVTLATGHQAKTATTLTTATATTTTTETTPPQERAQESVALADAAAAATSTVDARRAEATGDGSVEDGAAVLEKPLGMESFQEDA